SGTADNDTFTFGDGSTASITSIDMRGDDDKDKLVIGKSSVVNVGDIKNVERVTIGKSSVVNVGDVENVELVTIGDDGVFIIGSTARIEGAVTGSSKDNHLVVNAGGYVASLDLGKGEDSINFMFDGVAQDEGSILSIGSYLNDANFKINNQDAGWDQASGVDIDDKHKAWLTRDENNGITLSWSLS
ncbi:MAG: hypothetical protein MJ025_06170, partial [Victivallaceae bacterium]|nr:hypothetical protein [Victivallaceae bacterium]